MQVTKQQIGAYLELVQVVGRAIMDSPNGIPAGHLYAQLMGVVELGAFDRLIGRFIEAGLVRRDRSHNLVWTGPAMEGGAE